MAETGQPFVTAEDIAAQIGCDPSQVSSRLQRARTRGEVINVAPGGWVLGGPDSHLRDFIDDWMRHIGVEYHLGFGTASHAHIGSYQVVHSSLCVAVERPLKSRRLEVAGSHLGPPTKQNVRFVYRRNFHRYPTTVLRRRTPRRVSGHTELRVTTPEATALDCVLRPEHAGGWYGVENILARWLMWLGFSDFPDAPQLDAEKLAATAELYPLRVRQQTGHLLSSMLKIDALTHVEFDLAPLRATLPRWCPTVPIGGLRSGYHVIDYEWFVERGHTLDPDL